MKMVLKSQHTSLKTIVNSFHPFIFLIKTYILDGAGVQDPWSLNLKYLLQNVNMNKIVNKIEIYLCTVKDV